MVFCTRAYDGDTVTICFLAYRAKERLSKVVVNQFVTIRNEGTEKYGRVLADLETDEHKSIAEYMMEDPEICKPYSGGTKQKWD